MIQQLGVHDMVDVLVHYTRDHVTTEGGAWILLLNAILFVPLIFALFFYPVAVLTGIGVTTATVLGILALIRALQRHRQKVQQERELRS